jgi:hypothetical protein
MERNAKTTGIYFQSTRGKGESTHEFHGSVVHVDELGRQLNLLDAEQGVFEAELASDVAPTQLHVHRNDLHGTDPAGKKHEEKTFNQDSFSDIFKIQLLFQCWKANRALKLSRNLQTLKMTIFTSKACIDYSMARVQYIYYRCDNRRFWLSARNCQLSTPTSQNLEQQNRIFGAD